MSVEGMQLPRQQILQKQSGPIGANKGGALKYPLKTGDTTLSFKKQATQSFGAHSPDRTTNHIKVLERGTTLGTELQK